VALLQPEVGLLMSSAGEARERVFIGLGANLGNAERAVREAMQAIAALPALQWVAASSLYASAPVDATGPEFVNAVAEVRTALQPVELLRALHAMEDAQGRQRPFRNAPRTLDLDLLMFGQRVIESAELQLPHPRLHQRAFVLLPLLELAPDLQHPLHGALLHCVAQVGDQPIRRMDA
jgi:2-amino-4-hydroxy-6-hydroxymethyldihydropteridine diphosphokinase